MNVKAIYFSPTKSTERYVKTITQAMGEETEFVDITLPGGRESTAHIEDEIVVLGFPVYGTRIPKLAMEYFKTLQGNGNPLLCVAVYGNMETGIAFKQIKRMAERQNFKLAGAGAFVAQHAYANHHLHVALGRPDAEDLTFAHDFGERVMDKLNRNDFRMPWIDFPATPLVVEKAPYGMMRLVIQQPKPNLNVCTRCQKCKNRCPAGAITDSLEIDESQCLRCMSCVKVCPAKAREGRFKVKWMGELFAWLGRNRKINQAYI